MVLLPDRTKEGVDTVWKDAGRDTALVADTAHRAPRADSAALAERQRVADSVAADSARRVRRRHRRDSLNAVAESALARGDTALADSVRKLLLPRKRPPAPDSARPVTP
jgi:hypothetical protein